jgi:Inner membrane protein YgaP-like, transmembrane domain
MKTESYIRILAGTLVLVSLILARVAGPWWLLLAAFVGVNLVQSAFTGFCPAEIILHKLGLGCDAAQRGARP